MTVYTLDEVSDILKITKRTLYTYVQSGHLKASRIGRYWRVSEKQLQEFLDAGVVPVLDGNRAKTKNKSDRSE